MKANELMIGNLIETEHHGIRAIIGMETFDNLKDDFISIAYYLQESEWNHENGKPGKGVLRRVTNLMNCKPVPITPEWLEKLGFYYSPGIKLFVMDGSKVTCEYEEYKGAVNCSVYFWCKKNCFGVEVSNEHGQTADLFLPRIKYVHQLQNLYFVLTGESLTIREEVKNESAN